MQSARTLNDLRNSLSGKIYVYLKDTNARKKFLADAKAEGYSFGEENLPETIEDNIISLKKNKKLAYVGFVGRIEFQCNGGDNAQGKFHRIDYEKYKRGDDYFYYCYGQSERIKEVNSNFHGVIEIAGHNCEQAAKFLLLKRPSTSNDEEELFNFVEKKYNVIITIDD